MSCSHEPTNHETPMSRRDVLKGCAIGTVSLAGLNASQLFAQQATPNIAPTSQTPGRATPANSHPPIEGPRPWITTRGMYGAFPNQILERGESPADYGINAIWVYSPQLNHDDIKKYHDLGLKVYAEFNSLHAVEYLKDHPDAAPIGSDGKPCPPPNGWQGVSAFHAGHRKWRMAEFRRVLTEFDIDGIWLDYHHAHASWECPEPILPDTDFCDTALKQFTEKTGIELPEAIPDAAQKLLGEHHDQWSKFRCDVYTDWVREYREILNEVRSNALLGTFHCSWSPDEYDGAILHKLSIDLVAQQPYLDVFSIMPYHGRFGHIHDLEWIARQTQKLGSTLNLQGDPNEAQKIWPIMQLSDWGENVPAWHAPIMVEYGSRKPATGVMVFHWSDIQNQWDKAESLGRAYQAITPR